MPSTTPWEIPYPDGPTNLTALQSHFANIANAVNSALTNGLGGAPRLANSDAERLTLFPSPIQGNTVMRPDKGYVEQYYGLYNASTNPAGATPAGWYQAIEAGTAIIFSRGPNTTTVTNSGALITVDSGTFTVTRTGRVMINSSTITTQGGNVAGYMQTFVNGVQIGTGFRVASFSGTTPQFFHRGVTAKANSGSNTYDIKMSAEVGGLAYTANNVTTEVWYD